MKKLTDENRVGENSIKISRFKSLFGVNKCIFIRCWQITLLTLLIANTTMDARPWRVDQIPNGKKFGCINCHSSSSGRSLNFFGLIVDTKVGKGSRAQFWNVQLASLDSDGDGYTNGEELGDPDGDGTATADGQLTNPGYSSSLSVFPDPSPNIKIEVNEDNISISVKVNEQFRWENTRYESIEKFPMPFGNKSPHEIKFDELGEMHWSNTDIIFTGYYIHTTVHIDRNVKPKTRIVLGKNKVLASLRGLSKVIIGEFNFESNQLKFDSDYYIPYFEMPNILIEESADMRDWKKSILTEAMPKEYQWPNEIKIDLKKDKEKNTFYRIKIVKD